MNEQLDRIEKMLRAQLKSAGHIWWIGGFVYGVTSNNDLFIILYPADEKLNEKVVRLYPHDFKKLPSFIPTQGIDGGDTEANPNKEQARRKGIYHECPPFEVVTFDGRETQMGRERRFGDVLRVSRRVQQPPAAMQSAASQPPPPPMEREHSSSQPPARSTGPTNLPDYRYLALNAETADKFDYAAYMVLKNEMYSDVERITRARESLVPAWSPGNLPNAAMLEALRTYCEKRQMAEQKGDDSSSAHQSAKREAMLVYNREIKG